MAHELAFNVDGSAKMAYFGAVPWHGLGTRLDHPMTSAEAWHAAGLDYEVDLHQLETASGIPVTGHMATVRRDTSDILGIVTPKYQPIQNHQAFGFLDSLVSKGKLEYHTAGALGVGERVWMLAKLPDDIVIKGIDVSNKFLLLSNSHDGQQAMRIYYTAIRVVCANTLAMAHNGSRGGGAFIQHRGDLTAQFGDAQQTLGLARSYYDNLEAQINKLASFYPSFVQVRDYFKGLYPDPVKPKGQAGEDIKAKVENAKRGAAATRETLTRLFEGGLGNTENGIRHTGWALVNAVTEYVDHNRRNSDSTDPDARSRRLESNWFGDGAAKKAEAFRSALAMASNS